MTDPEVAHSDSVAAVLRTLALAEQAVAPLIDSLGANRLIQSLQSVSAAITLAGRPLKEMLGVTFAYDTVFRTYAPDGSRLEAPDNGVRYVLDAREPNTQRLARPLVEIGWADLSEFVPNGDTLLSVMLVETTGQPNVLVSASGFDTGPNRYRDSSMYDGSALLPAGEGSIRLGFHTLRRGNTSGFWVESGEYEASGMHRGVRIAYSKTTHGFTFDADSRGTARVVMPTPQSTPDSTVVEVTFDQYACGAYAGVIRINGDSAATVGTSGFVVLGDTINSDTLWTFWKAVTSCLELEAAFETTTGAVLAPMSAAYRTASMPAGDLEVQVTTRGSPVDPDGYVVAVTEGASTYRWARMGDQQRTSFAALPSGTQAVEVLGVSPNCVVFGEVPRPVMITAGAASLAVFDVECGSAELRAGTIVYDAATPGGSRELFLVEADGSGGRQLTTSARVFQEHSYTPTQVAWAPDGVRLAFVTAQDGNGEIYLVGSDGGPPRNLTNHQAYDGHPSWSPDGTRIAFVSTRDRSVFAPQGSDLYVVPVNGGSTVRVTARDAPLSHVAWSLDGTRIAFVARDDGASSNLYVVDAGVTSVRQIGPSLVKLTHFTYGGPEGPAAWSPEGSRLVFSGRDLQQSTQGIYVVGADGSGLVRLTEGGGFLSAPSWSPNGNQILFGRAGDIHVISSDGTGVRFVAKGQSSAWSPNGVVIAFSRFGADDQEIHIAATDGSWTSRLTRPPGTERYPRSKQYPWWKP